MFMYIMAFMAVRTVVTDFYAVRHINAMAFTFRLTYTAANAIERFNDNASEKGEEPNIIFALSAI